MDVKEEKTKDEEKSKFCLQCGKEIPPGSIRFSVRKFCSRKCNRRYFSLKRYHKIKKDEDYQDYRKKYMKKWINRNRERFNASMRKASLKYQQKKKEERAKKDGKKNI